jgi:uncharacterized membrane protein YkoI
MTGIRTLAVAGASATAGAAVVVVGALTFSGQDDPQEQVSAVDVGRLDITLPSEATQRGGSTGQQVAALDRVRGTLARGDDADEFSVGQVELGFGPESWVVTAGPLEDYDGDGEREDLRTELESLVGQPVTALVRLDDDGDEADVYFLNNLPYQDTAGAPAPWLTAPDGTPADVASPQQITELAARAVGPGARVEEVDPEVDGNVAWEAEVIDASGREYTVLLDATGEVLDISRDD